MFKNTIKTINDNYNLLTALIRFKKVNNTDNNLYGVFSDIYVALDGIISCLFLTPALSVLGSFSAENIINALDMFSSMLIYLETFIPKIANISSILNTSVSNLDNSLFNSIIDLIKNINKTVIDVCNINISSPFNKNLIAFALNDFYRKTSFIESYINRINVLNKRIGVFNYNKGDLSDVNVAMTDINDTIQSIKNSFKDDTAFINRYKVDDLDIIQKKVNTFSEIVREMIKISSMSLTTPIDETVFNTIGEGISSINEKVSKINDNKIKQIEKETKSLSGFIKVVDNINVSKASSLTSLMDSMANLADKMGGFDRLTEMLNGDLKEVLSTLSEKIDEAKETIKRAERIETERQKKLQDNIKNIKGLMKEAITINVGKLDDDNSIKAGYEKTK